MPPKLLTIAGFDGSGGAGIQADLKVFTSHNCYGMTVLTALPVQNTCGVQAIYELPEGSISGQLQAIFEDISPDAIKIGMLFNSTIIYIVGEYLRKYAGEIPIILDPVMIAKSGDPLLLPDSIAALKSKLIPLAHIITPNLPEASELLCYKITEKEEMEPAANALLALGPKAVLLKGGHLEGEFVCDLFVDQSGTKLWLESKRIITKNTHGTGCTLSAAIAANLGLGLDTATAVRRAHSYTNRAIASAKDWKIGNGNGPLNHLV